MAQNKANPEYNDPLNIVRDLRVQLRLPQDQQNSNLIQAYTRELMSRGDDGMNALEDLVDSGVLQGHSGDRAVQNMLNTIGTSNEVKGKNRSLYNSVNNMRNHATDAAEFDNAARADNVRDLRASGDALRDRSPEELVNLGNRDFEAVANSTEDWAQNARVSMMSDSRLFSMLNGGRRTNLASGITQGFNRSIEVAGNINDDDTRNAALHQIGEQAHNIINNPNASRYFTPDDAQNVRSVIGVSGYVSPEQQAAQQQADVADQQIQQNQQIFEQIQQANAAAQGRAIYEGMREEQRNTQQQFQNYADTATPNLLGTYDAPAGFDPHDVDSHGNYRHEMYGGATTFNPITGEIVDNSDGQEMRYRPRTPHP